MVVILADSLKSPIIASAEHVFFIKNRGWIRVDEINIGDFFVDKNGNDVKIQKIDKIEYSTYKNVYD